MNKTIMFLNVKLHQLCAAEETIASKLGYDLLMADGMPAALERIHLSSVPKIDVVVMNSTLSGSKTLECVKQIKYTRPDLPVLVLLPFGGEHLAEALLKAGASDYLVKPVSITRLKLTLEKLIHAYRLERYVALLERALPKEVSIADIMKNSPPSIEAREIAEQSLPSHFIIFDEHGRVKKLRHIEEAAIRYAVENAEGCMTKAARNLGIGRSTLYRKVDALGMQPYISRANQTTRPMMLVSAMERS